jgi:2-oxoglutarate dehydrogenase complex dehydrogenase (E1) component-like enzyme
MSQLPDYKVGGCVYLVVNNQVAQLPTDPRHPRSSPTTAPTRDHRQRPSFMSTETTEAVQHV